MTIGPLSEWVSAIAEIIAVCVALFLPYFTAAALNGDETHRKELAVFLNVAFLISTNAKEQELISTGMQISSLLKDADANRQEIEQLIAQLN